jgi:hypothetical protein
MVVSEEGSAKDAEGIGGDIITGKLDICLEELRSSAKNLWVICAKSEIQTGHIANAGQTTCSFIYNIGLSLTYDTT